MSLLVFLIPCIGHGVDIEFGLPDTLQDLAFWDKDGSFIGNYADTPPGDDLHFSVLPQSGIVDTLDVYELKVVVPPVGIPNKGGLAFLFPGEFDLSYIDSLAYADDYDGDDLEIRKAFIFYNIMALFFKHGVSPPPGTEITLTIALIKNPIIAGQYRLSGLLFNAGRLIVAGPSLSDFFTIYPGDPVSLEIVPGDPLVLKAGQSRLFTAAGLDQFGNAVGDLACTWSFATGSDQIGTLIEGLLLATTTGVGRIQADCDGLTAQSESITVEPGLLENFIVSGTPSETVAGQSFSSDVAVAAYDGYGNLKTDYTGAVYFVSSDNDAVLYHGQNNPYSFSDIDSGKHVFPGEQFTLITSGTQTISVTDGIRIAASDPINVKAGPVVSFQLQAFDSVVAGEAYRISITDAVDQYGNPANATVQISLLAGGPAPDGTEPILNDVIVSDGSGHSDQFLFATGRTIIEASISPDYALIKSLTVFPTQLGALSLEIESTQFVGNQLFGPAVITAYDLYGNLKTDFNASTDPVKLTVEPGEMQPSVLDDAGDFIAGIADLTAREIIYSGQGGLVMLTAISGPVASSPVELFYNGVTMEFSEPIPDTILVNQGVGAVVQLANNANLRPLYPMRLTGYFTCCPEDCIDSQNVYPPEPGNSILRDIVFQCDALIPNSEDSLAVEMLTRYEYYNDTIVVFQRLVHPFFVLKNFELEYVTGSLSIDTVFSGSTLDSVRLQITVVDGPPLAGSSNINALLSIDPAGDGTWVTFGWNDQTSLSDNIIRATFYNLEVPDLTLSPNLAEGYKALKFSGQMWYKDMHINLPELTGFDSIFIVKRADVFYVESSLTPAAVAAGQEQSFAFDLSLSGMTTIELDVAETRFELLYDNNIISTFLIGNDLTLSEGISHIITESMYIPGNLSGSKLAPRLLLVGTEWSAPRADTISFGDETISVSGGPQVKIAEINLVTINPPYVNIEQEFSIGLRIENTSELEVSDGSAYILTSPAGDTVSQVHNLTIPAQAGHDILLNLSAPSESSPAQLYKAAISFPGAAIMPPDDDVIAVVVQSPAQIELEYSLSGTFEGYVDFGQSFVITVHLKNLGEAEAGPGEVSLLSGGVDFGLPDSAAFVVSIEDFFPIELVAPVKPASANLVLKITGAPLDRNTGLPAPVLNGSAQIPITVEPSEAELIVTGAAIETPLIDVGSIADLFVLNLYNNTGGTLNVVGLKSIIVEIKNKFDRLISPERILEPAKSGFHEDGMAVSSGVEIGRRLILDFDDFQIGPKETRTIVFRGSFNETIAQKEFRISFDSRDSRAIYISGPRVNLPVPVVGELGGAFNIGANFVVTQPGSRSIIMWKNPFNPDVEMAEFSYRLQKDATIEMTLYTLTGEKVLERSFPAGTRGGSAGTNIINWDGKNGEGHVVLNGVYILVLENASTGERFDRFKVAVLK
ncbi:MAG: hypothetical protein JSV44_10645 [Candidatus Zixiibacteriota bacterium]|nr:MAG: hypothetical protein JSV44_10645 [candidate division Zixibacteria bacterium]